jgi:hypothetical protein
LPERHPAPGKVWFKEKNSGRSNSPETNESGNYEENRRTTAIGEEHAGRAENGKDGKQNNFNGRDRHHCRNVTGDRFNLSVGNGNDGAIVIVGNGAAVQPCMKRRIRLGHRQQQPHGERQYGRGRVQTQPPTTIYDISVSQIICNIAKRMPVARISRFF